MYTQHSRNTRPFRLPPVSCQRRADLVTLAGLRRLVRPTVPSLRATAHRRHRVPAATSGAHPSVHNLNSTAKGWACLRAHRLSVPTVGRRAAAAGEGALHPRLLGTRRPTHLALAKLTVVFERAGCAGLRGTVTRLSAADSAPTLRPGRTQRGSSPPSRSPPSCGLEVPTRKARGSAACDRSARLSPRPHAPSPRVGARPAAPGVPRRAGRLRAADRELVLAPGHRGERGGAQPLRQ